jgi:hypothetical protein
VSTCSCGCGKLAWAGKVGGGGVCYQCKGPIVVPVSDIFCSLACVDASEIWLHAAMIRRVNLGGDLKALENRND